MEVDDKMIDRLADLAKLQFTGEEKEVLKKDLANILNFMHKLNEVDTEGVKPMVYVNDEQDTLRKDEVKQEISKEEALKNAPTKDSDYIKVAKVLSK